MLLRSGKYRGHSVEDVKQRDKLYCGWLIRAHREHQALPPDLRKAAKQLHRRHGGVLTVGAHKGTFFDEVLEKHPGYGDWAGSSCFRSLRLDRDYWGLLRSDAEKKRSPVDLRAPGDGIKDFADYVLAKKRCAEDEAEKENDEKRPRSEAPNDKKSCCVCMDRPATSAFVPCGHMCACLTCAQDLEHGGQCPICRGEIAMTLRIYA